jgi:hypothetical protein
VTRALDYDETVRVLRASLVEAAGNAWAFGLRSRARPTLLSSRAWQELGAIEAVLVQHLEAALRRELRVEPRPLATRLRMYGRGLCAGLAGERSLVTRLLRESLRSPVQAWREAAPQLEAALWPFFVARTQYLANTLALALDEPTSFSTLVWHPGRREFHRRGD